MRYGSIGWSVGATLGYAFASGPKSRIRSAAVPNGLDQQPDGGKRVLSLIGDGSFQMTAQDVSTMLRYSLTPIIILVGHGGTCSRLCCCECGCGFAHDDLRLMKA
jgi:pyruvate decarboxylase